MNENLQNTDQQTPPVPQQEVQLPTSHAVVVKKSNSVGRFIKDFFAVLFIGIALSIGLGPFFTTVIGAVPIPPSILLGAVVLLVFLAPALIYNHFRHKKEQMTSWGAITAAFVGSIATFLLLLAARSAFNG